MLPNVRHTEVEKPWWMPSSSPSVQACLHQSSHRPNGVGTIYCPLPHLKDEGNMAWIEEMTMPKPPSLGCRIACEPDPSASRHSFLSTTLSADILSPVWPALQIRSYFHSIHWHPSQTNVSSCTSLDFAILPFWLVCSMSKIACRVKFVLYFLSFLHLTLFFLLLYHNNPALL